MNPCPTCGISSYWLERLHPSNAEAINNCPDSFHDERRAQFAANVAPTAHELKEKEDSSPSFGVRQGLGAA